MKNLTTLQKANITKSFAVEMDQIAELFNKADWDRKAFIKRQISLLLGEFTDTKNNRYTGGVAQFRERMNDLHENVGEMFEAFHHLPRPEIEEVESEPANSHLHPVFTLIVNQTGKAN